MLTALASILGLLEAPSRLSPTVPSRVRPPRRDVPRLNRFRLWLDEHLLWRIAQPRRGIGAALVAIDAHRLRLAGLTDDDFATELAADRTLGADAQHPRRGAALMALAVDAVRRETGLVLRRPQVECALRLLWGECAELRTGEGKTLAAITAALVGARAGAQVHVVTVNDYLAARDHALAEPIARRMGLRCAVITAETPDSQKRAAYDADILYGTNKTFVFDHLRDLREGRTGALTPPRQTGQSMAIVDEADSVLIDDATTPMILSETGAPPPGPDVALFEDLVAFARAARDSEERGRDPKGAWRLTPRGLRGLAVMAEQWAHPAARDDGLIELAEMALQAVHGLVEGVHWVRRVPDPDAPDSDAPDPDAPDVSVIAMVDQSTGRIMADRRWAYGLQQMVEIAAGLPPSPETRTVGQVTQQTYFRQYRHLAGLTGTAREARGELWAIYRLRVAPIAPHRPSQMKTNRLRVHRLAAARWLAVAEEAAEVARRRAVLIGLNDVREARALADVLAGRGVAAAVLDATSEAQEAEIIATAGQPGRITIATHLAGRGTDIGLEDQVRTAGGLHVIVASAMGSGRLERQLIGRAGRQGDPGSSSRHVALDDRGLVDGGVSPGRLSGLALLRLKLMPAFGLALVQAARDAQARALRRRSLLREQDLARRLGYRSKMK
jgi:preprotein translocase subunit SecA